MRAVGEDDEPPTSQQASLSDAAIAAVCALGEAGAPVPSGPCTPEECAASALPLAAKLRLQRAAARARDAVAGRNATEKQVVGYFELISEPGAYGCVVILRSLG